MTQPDPFTLKMQRALAPHAAEVIVVTDGNGPRLAEVAEIMVQGDVQQLSALCRLFVNHEAAIVWGQRIGFDLYEPRLAL